MTDAREFHLGDVLSVITGKMVALDHIAGVARVLYWMTGSNPSMTQIPAMQAFCAPKLAAQYPDLTNIVVPQGMNEAGLQAWLEALAEHYGNFLPVARLEESDRPALNEAMQAGIKEMYRR